MKNIFTIDDHSIIIKSQKKKDLKIKITTSNKINKSLKKFG